MLPPFFCVAARRSVRLVPRRVRGFPAPLSVNPRHTGERRVVVGADPYGIAPPQVINLWEGNRGFGG